MKDPFALPGMDPYTGKIGLPKTELLHNKLMEMTHRAHKNERLVIELLAETKTLITVQRRALASLCELHTKTGMIEFWGESDEMPEFIHHPVTNAKSDISHTLSRLREWEEKLKT